MARSGMANLIGRLRGLTNTAPADYTVAGVSYWSDEQLQTALDRHHVDLNYAPLRSEFEYGSAGSVTYKNYYASYGNLEESTSGTAYWQVYDASGSAVGTASYTADYATGWLRWGADTAGSAYYLTARSYRLERAAADIWRQKAAQAASSFDFQTDDQHFSKSQLIKHYLDMAAQYDRMGGVQAVRLVRTDLNPGGHDLPYKDRAGKVHDVDG